MPSREQEYQNENLDNCEYFNNNLIFEIDLFECRYYMWTIYAHRQSFTEFKNEICEILNDQNSDYYLTLQ